MSDDVIIALVGLISAIGGALASNLYAAAKNRLEAYQLAQEMQADNQRLWQWNRAAARTTRRPVQARRLTKGDT